MLMACQLITSGTLVACFCRLLTVLFLFTQIRKWKKWEEEIQKIAAENGIRTQLLVLSNRCENRVVFMI
jgi:hypothetical protein